MAEKKEVLKGHKKVGSKFIPPMMQLPNWSEISYVNQILPEIMWMGLLNDRYGYREGIKLASNFAKRAFELRETDKHINFTLVSNFNQLSSGKKAELLRGLEADSTLAQYRDSLSPLTRLYDNFPLSFIGQSEDELSNVHLVDAIKVCIEKHIDKYETPSLIIQANVLHIRASTGGLKIALHIDFPNLNALIESPDSEEARRAAGFVRISAMQELMPSGEQRSDDWSRSFWNQGYKIDKCDFSWEENDINE